MKTSPSIEIIGTESLGVRGMCCLVSAGSRKILIDPGVALGYMRHGLLPHPCQIERGGKIRQRILAAVETATDIVFSHFHGDHIPLLRANPYQLSFAQLPRRFRTLPVRAHSPAGLSPRMQRRAAELSDLCRPNMKPAPGYSDALLSFSDPVPHGSAGSTFGTVMMTRIDMKDKVFVHASDIQLLDSEPVEKILAWQPDIVFTSGPPLYLQSLTGKQRQQAWENAFRLADGVETLIVDHHLLRDEQGLDWMNNLSRAVGKKIFCAADFMRKARCLLEARRCELYATRPISGSTEKMD
ncbi:MAG TPA: hypothetical protein ENK96_04845 [Desulfobulbaceae bacterium]|nr:hypothetical protein [Desulfobulbaceae bacterium]